MPYWYRDEEEKLDLTKHIKISVMGDIGVGKTYLLHSYTCERYGLKDHRRPPPSHLLFFGKIYVDERYAVISLYDIWWDISLGRGFDLDHKMRKDTYKETNVFLVCFSLVEPESYENIYKRWAPELETLYTHVPVILVGTKKDLVNDRTTLEELRQRNLCPLTSEDGLRMAHDIGAVQYVEVSAELQLGCTELMHDAIRAVWEVRDACDACDEKVTEAFGSFDVKPDVPRKSWAH